MKKKPWKYEYRFPMKLFMFVKNCVEWILQGSNTSINQNYIICNVEWYIGICIDFLLNVIRVLFIAVGMEILIKAWRRCHKDHHKGKKNNSAHPSVAYVKTVIRPAFRGHCYPPSLYGKMQTSCRMSSYWLMPPVFATSFIIFNQFSYACAV